MSMFKFLGSSQYYASSEEVIHILKCEKPVSQHLRGLSCDTDLQIPEGLLILYRYGNFSLDSSTLEKYIYPKHRDNLEIYWRRQQRRCQSTFHPTNSHAKVERGIQAQVAKEIWMESGVYIPVGAGHNELLQNKWSVLDPFAQDQPISGKLHKFADSRIEDTHDQLPCLEENQPIAENSMNISTCSTSSAYFCCPDFSCDKVFATSNNLDRHLLIGNHNYRKNTISSMDTAVQIYSSSCIDLQKYHENVIQEVSHEVEISVNLNDKSRKDKVKTYLQEICASCEKTGSRPDFIALSEELRKATDENGHKLFTKEEWLNPPQIKGYIANIISKSKSSLAVKKPRAELQEVNVDDDEKLSEVVAI
ncbi:unnamed protein product [Mytilus coruscus]|uniref:C2H2-type domain-containing protein n=1 Tax=Mytilus coruscus TaxID=42192 RepID=A0A6J8CVH2_MYTCO|nr:unnamed protein product [Mytilus coruscus]